MNFERQYVDSIKPNFREDEDDDGNIVAHWFLVSVERYRYDAKLLREGWKQWDTDQDASYFGVWVNVALRQTLCFAEGDVYQTFCPDVEHFRAAIAKLEAFHGKAPSIAIAYDNDGTRTVYVGERLKKEDIE